MNSMLIVDDEAFARKAVVSTNQWQQYGIEVYQASSGREALEIMKRQPVDLLMTDIKMPEMSGLQLIEKVHENGYDPSIIVLSSFNEFELVRSAMQMGASDYLFKPSMMPADILQSVRKVLEKRTDSSKRQAEAGFAERKKEYLRLLILGEDGKEMRRAVPDSELAAWNGRKTFVISLKLKNYHLCLTNVFEGNLNLLQFSIGNILSEVFCDRNEFELIRMNNDEYTIIGWNHAPDTELQAVAHVSQELITVFSFLKLHYQMDAVAGISRISRGISRISEQYAEASRLSNTFEGDGQKIYYSSEIEEFGSIKKEIQQALMLISENLCNPELSLGFVADAIGISKNHFSKTFKEEIGTKFVDYVTRQRMEMARNLYMNTDLKIYEIAERLGYSDWHYLYNLYKKTFGYSMSQEKKNEKYHL